MSIPSIPSLVTRQTDLTASTKHIKQLTQQLASLKPRSSSEDEVAISVEDDLEARNDLSAEIHAYIKQGEEELLFLRQDVEDQEEMSSHRSSGRSAASASSNSERTQELARLNAGCVKLGEDLRLCRARFRRAQLAASASANRAAQKERAVYLSDLQAAAAATGVPPTSISDVQAESQPQTSKYTSLFTGRRPQKAKDPNAASMNDDILLTATSDVTTSLKRTHALLADELSRSHFAQDTLDTSNAALQQLNTRYSSFDDLLTKSGGLLKQLVTSKKSDTWYLTTATYILMATIGWLLFRRLVYGPAWWFIWLPIKMAFYTLMKAIGVVGFLGRSAVRRPTSDVGGERELAMSRAMSGASVQPTFVPSSSAGDAQAMRSPTGSLSERIGEATEAAWTWTTLGVREGGIDEAAWTTSFPSEPIEDATRAAWTGTAPRPTNNAPKDGPRRGDGEPLRERNEDTEPRNPKKRMMEEEVDLKDEKQKEPPKKDDDKARKKDEL